MDFRVRPAVSADQRAIADLIHFEAHVHRHLDWRDPLDWIGAPPYLVIEWNGRVVAALACPPDPPQLAWIRLFVSSDTLLLQEAWSILWEAAQADLGRETKLVAVIALQDWFRKILKASGFAVRQQIVMLERKGEAPGDGAPPLTIKLRRMMTYDLPAVADIDAAAFDPLWQNSLSALNRAYSQAMLATVAEFEQYLIGYQFSTQNPLGAHLARLAVRQEAQGYGVGRALVSDLLQTLARRGASRLTVNTQEDNASSLSLYKKLGFIETGDRFPVFEFQVH
ncbi:MAG: GNAT family N-acetyltransferase [Anaerolineales bacterium]|nr:GNAT family N-acetyltransferase [Anaerolineales bacterium]